MPNGEDDRAEVERQDRRQRVKDRIMERTMPSEPEVDKMHADDNAQSEKDAERFDEEQRASALATAQAYIKEHGEGDQLVVGRLTSNVGPNYGELRKGIVPDPITGRGDARGPGYDDPATWPLPPTHPSPRPSAADKTAQRKLEDAIERMGEEKLRRDAQIDLKDTNPKDAVGIRKWRVFTTVPFTIIWELGVAMMEGARKYGRHNYRVAGVRGSVYIDAAMGHLTQWWEGEDLDRDTGLSHITKAMASLCVLRDAMIQNKFVDDRPPRTDVAAVRDELQARVDDIFERIPEAVPAYVEGDQHGDKE